MIRGLVVHETQHCVRVQFAYITITIVIYTYLPVPQAFGTTGAFADRLCVATEGDFNQLISAEELTFCCHRCGFGCNGGYPIKAWEYFRRHGVVTGGNYNTTEVIIIIIIIVCR